MGDAFVLQRTAFQEFGIYDAADLIRLARYSCVLTIRFKNISDLRVLDQIQQQKLASPLSPWSMNHYSWKPFFNEKHSKYMTKTKKGFVSFCCGVYWKKDRCALIGKEWRRPYSKKAHAYLNKTKPVETPLEIQALDTRCLLIWLIMLHYYLIFSPGLRFSQISKENRIFPEMTEFSYSNCSSVIHKMEGVLEEHLSEWWIDAWKWSQSKKKNENR